MKTSNKTWGPVWALAACSLIGCCRAAWPAGVSIEERIHHVEEDLIPEVLVTGEVRQRIKLTDRMAALKVRGLSIAVIHNGKIEWARAYGVTTDGGPPVTPATLFQAASISKPVSALAALHLVQSGKLDLDTDVNRYLKRWKVPSNRFTDQTKVTLQELLTHTAGMTVHGFPGYKSTDRLPTLEQVLNGTTPANTPAIYVDMPPGTQWRYSGGGYVVMQQLIEDVTGQPYSRFLKDAVLGPIGMSHSTFEQPLPRKLVGSVALPHDSDGQLLEGGPHTYPEEAPAGLWTNPSDLARYAIEVQSSVAGKSTRVLSQAMTRRMLSPGVNHWGLGPNLGGSAEHPYFEHGGANAGYQCELIAYEDGDGVVLMTNSDNGGALMREVVGTIAYEYQWPDFRPTTHTIARIEPRRFDLLVGSYQLAPMAVLTIAREGDHFFYQATHQGQVEIYPEDERQYFAKDIGALVTFETDEAGKGKRVTLHQSGNDMVGQRLDDATDKAIVRELAAINKRVRDQVAVTGSEPAVRRLMSEIVAGKPDYERMSPTFADVIRQRIEELQKYALQLGRVESVTFQGVRAGGADLYLVTCEHGAVQWAMLLSTDGKIDNATFQLMK